MKLDGCLHQILHWPGFHKIFALDTIIPLRPKTTFTKKIKKKKKKKKMELNETACAPEGVPTIRPLFDNTMIPNEWDWSLFRQLAILCVRRILQE
jgi:hypothetical protein